MSATLGFILPFLIPLAMLAIVASSLKTRSHRARRNASDLAQHLGLTLEPAQPVLGWFYPPPKMRGFLRERAASLWTYSRRSGKSRQTWTAISVTAKAHRNLTFNIAPQGLLSSVQGLFGVKEIKVGDPTFDNRWFIVTNAPAFLQAALIPEIREKFLTLPGTLRCENGTVTYTERGHLSSEEKCTRFAKAAALASAMVDVVETHAP